ncbi:MAG TPA: hypothetical protein VEW28_02840 [Candidatus Kapabacteria bacterium]|nr:hypothetical protein [Candidatus Kapabacteria bacterium]
MQLLIETDILHDYLTHTGEEPSVLRQALSRATCYTTMLNAMEVFALSHSTDERDAVMNMLMVVRVLGFSGRYAEGFAELGKRFHTLSQRELLVAGMASVSKLTILTERFYDRYAIAGGIAVIRSLEEVPDESE